MDWWSFFIGYLCGFLTLVPVVFYAVHAIGEISRFR